MYHNVPLPPGYQQYPPPLYTPEEVLDGNRPLLFQEALTEFHASMNTILKHPSHYGVIFNHRNYQIFLDVVFELGGIEHVINSKLWGVVLQRLHDGQVISPTPPLFRKILKKVYLNYLAHFECAYLHRFRGYKNKMHAAKGALPFFPLMNEAAGDGLLMDEEFGDEEFGDEQVGGGQAGGGQAGGGQAGGVNGNLVGNIEVADNNVAINAVNPEVNGNGGAQDNNAVNPEVNGNGGAQDNNAVNPEVNGNGGAQDNNAVNPEVNGNGGAQDNNAVNPEVNGNGGAQDNNAVNPEVNGNGGAQDNNAHVA